MEGILKVTKFPRAHLFGLRRDGSGRHIAGASFEEATQGSLCESIRAGQMVEHALLLHISEEVSSCDSRATRTPARPSVVSAGVFCVVGGGGGVEATFQVVLVDVWTQELILRNLALCYGTALSP